MTSAVGIILVDVDGVLNPYAAKPCRRPAGYTTHRLRPSGWEHATNALRVWLTPDHGPLLLDLSRSTGWDLVWATTWHHDANRMISPRVGLPELPVIDFGAHPGTLRGWKYPAVTSYCARRPLVWFDDDFGNVHTAHALSAFRDARGKVPTLLHHVDPTVGLSLGDMTTVREWIGGLDVLLD